MSTMAPSHPDDVVLRNRLADEMIANRHAAGLSQSQLAELVGVRDGSVYAVERNRPANPRVSTLVEYAHPARRRLVLELCDVVDLEPLPAEQALLAGGYVGAAMVAHLRRWREHAGISRKDIEAQHGWKWYSLAALEYGDREPYLSTLQRYARVLGGRLDARWEAW